MIHADRFSGGTTSGTARSGPPSRRVSVRLVDPGQQPLELLGALFKMGCPADLAYDYLEAAVLGNQPEVLVGAEATAAVQLAETLRDLGATVTFDPPFEPAVRAEQSSGPSTTEHPVAEPGPVFEPKLVVGQPGPRASLHVEPSLRSKVEPPPGPTVNSAFRLPAETPLDSTIVLSDHQQGPPSGRAEIEAVERYLAAYNAGNEAKLVACFSPSAVLSDATGRVLVEGAEAIGQRMAEVFAHYPDSRAAVMGRQVAGPWVLDHHGTTYGGGASEETVVCFRVSNGFIDRLVLLTMD